MSKFQQNEHIPGCGGTLTSDVYNETGSLPLDLAWADGPGLNTP